MRKKLLIGLLSGLMCLSVVGCGESKPVNVNVSSDESLSGSTFGIDNLIKIGNGLYYDKTTRIVYFWNGYLGCNYLEACRSDTTPSPYYAPNGLPYKYNQRTNTFEEIDDEVSK